MKRHSDYLFTECKACPLKAQGRPTDSERWEIRSRHWRKAALELQKQRDGLVEAAKPVLAIYGTLPGGKPKVGKWTALADAIRTVAEGNGHEHD